MGEIVLPSGDIVLVDDADMPRVSQYNWYKVGRNIPYAATKAGKRYIWMHRLIAHPQEDEQVDHINHNGLDNRRENLRAVSAHQNRMNARKQHRKTPCTSKYLGVHKRDIVGHPKPFIASCCINRKTYNLGTFATEEDAASAYDIFKILASPEHALTNEMPKVEVSYV